MSYPNRTGIKIHFLRNSDKRAQKKLDKLRKQIPNLAVPHKRIEVMLHKWVQENFDSDGALAMQGGWKPFALGGRLNLKTGKIDTTAQLLRDKGTLRKSFKSFSNKSNAGIGTKVHYAKKHELGDPSAKWGGRSAPLPQRKMLPTHKQLLKEAKDIYEGWIKQMDKQK